MTVDAPGPDSTAAQAFYDRWAGVYDALATRAPGVAGLRRAAADALAPGRGDVVVEMGCGTGANFPYFRERVGPEGVVVGVDFSPGVLALARERVARKGWSNVHVVRGDATRPPFAPPVPAASSDGTDDAGRTPAGEADAGRTPAGEVDAVVATFLTGMLDDPGAAVDRWADLVGDGGRLCLLNLGRSTHPFGRWLNAPFVRFVRAGAPDGGGRDPAARLDRRIAAAHGRLRERCADATYERRLLGFARLSAGTVGESETEADPRG